MIGGCQDSFFGINIGGLKEGSEKGGEIRKVE